MYLCILYYIYTYIYIYIWYVPIFICTQVNIKLYIYVYIYISSIYIHILIHYIYICISFIHIIYIYIHRMYNIMMWILWYDSWDHLRSAPIPGSSSPCSAEWHLQWVQAPAARDSQRIRARTTGKPWENHGETMGKWWLIWLNGIWIWPCGQSLHNYMILYGKIHHFLMGNSHYFYGHFP